MLYRTQTDAAHGDVCQTCGASTRLPEPSMPSYGYHGHASHPLMYNPYASPQPFAPQIPYVPTYAVSGVAPMPSFGTASSIMFQRMLAVMANALQPAVPPPVPHPIHQATTPAGGEERRYTWRDVPIASECQPPTASTQSNAFERKPIGIVDTNVLDQRSFGGWERASDAGSSVNGSTSRPASPMIGGHLHHMIHNRQADADTSIKRLQSMCECIVVLCRGCF